ncbi:MAG: Unknown protein [uncultured Sulfurovum sp.]|uniref:Thioredoxin domain-containing protein n=1 Tax=uncultured Sulfurovum sp. TaxID=269237 RepID=A0A6S6TRZ1_9BACT|nr:MAG: Unknown protein [uncultured Sulfurovum sp.]
MKKTAFLSFLSLVTVTFVFAEELSSPSHFEALPFSKADESLPIAKTLEEEARDKEKIQTLELEENNNTDVIQEAKIQDENISVVSVQEEAQVQALSYETVLAQAKRENKIIMLSIRSTDCKYCDRMDEETLSDESVKQELAKDFLILHYNQDLEALPLELQEGATPMFIFVNKNEDILNMYPGMRNPEEFKEALTQILTQ